MVVTAELIRTFPIFKSVPAKSTQAIANSSKIQKFNRRAVVLTAGRREEGVCFLFEGRLQGVDFTIDGREVGLYFVEAGGFCGELALFDTNPQTEHVIALTPAVTVFVPVIFLQGIIKEHPEILNFLSINMASRIREMTFQRALLGLPNIAQRVCCQLWSLIPDEDKRKQESSEIKNPPTHMEIAIMLNVSRETVSRVFQSLQGQAIVRRDGSATLKIVRLNTLKNLAEGSENI